MGKIELISPTLRGLFIGLFHHYDLFALTEIVLLIIHLFIYSAISCPVPTMKEQDRRDSCPRGVLLSIGETSNKEVNH